LRELAAKGISWIVDPIDGTANFVSAMPLSVVSIGILQDGIPVYGIVYDPARDELFCARKGKGAFLNGVPIRVSPQDTLGHAMIGTGFPHDRRENWLNYRDSHTSLLTRTGKVRMLGATALEMCWVASGRLDAFIEHGPKAWDVAGAGIIVEEAGGSISSFAEDADRPYSVFARSILASNGALHQPLTDLLRENSTSAN
jgi:myo-inositol-1(or 4)-monophosphatase